MTRTLSLLLVLIITLLSGCGWRNVTGDLEFSPQQLLFESGESICSGILEGFLTCDSKARFEFANQSTHYVRLVDSTRGYSLGQENMPTLKVVLKKGQKFHFAIKYEVQISEDGRELVFDFAESGHIKIPISEIHENHLNLNFNFDNIFMTWSVIEASGFASFKISLPEELN